MARKRPTSPKSMKAHPEHADHGHGGELHQRPAIDGERLTTNLGIPLADNQNSLRAGVRGPTLIEDFILREKIHHFDHERIPERIVHARGSGAHGVFTLKKSLKKFTRARVLTEVGAETEVFVRFSTVAGGAGSVDTPRDVRGFAVKFYTTEGNWDLVGNNIPVFFIQDAMKFPDLVHSVKMEADRGYPQSASAHDTFWDFVGLMPESTHMVMWAMSDRGIPRAFRFMEGFGVHSFRLVNDDGDATFVKFHWRPVLGLQSTCWDEAVKIAGADPDYQRRDLFTSIASKRYPEWDLGVQLLSEKEAAELSFDVLDPTKLIPEELHPVQVVGRMVLNRNPDNFFAETEQVAFLPTNVPPGIDFSEDPLLQGRAFSYLDTQLSRLGSTNWHQLPVNQAKGCPFANFQRDGQMQTMVPKGRANYEPNSLAEVGEIGGPRPDVGGFTTAATAVTGHKVRQRSETFADHYSQARLFYRSQSAPEQAHLAAALVFELSKLTLSHVRTRVLANLRNVDEDLASRVATGLGVSLPAASTPAAPVKDLPLSPALRIIGKYPVTSEGRAAAILVTDGADGRIVDGLVRACKAAGAAVTIVAQKIGGVTLADGRVLGVDGQLAGTPSVLFDGIAVVASTEGAALLVTDAAARDFVANAFVHLKVIAYTPEALPLLDDSGVIADPLVLAAGADAKGFASALGIRRWEREPAVRPLP